jgi:hypothetical protein
MKAPGRNKAQPQGKTPKGFRRKKSISAANAHLLVATSSAFMAPPPFMCQPTGPAPAPCLRFGYDAKSKTYSIPPYGELVDCEVCKRGTKA